MSGSLVCVIVNPEIFRFEELVAEVATILVVPVVVVDRMAVVAHVGVVVVPVDIVANDAVPARAGSTHWNSDANRADAHRSADSGSGGPANDANLDAGTLAAVCERGRGGKESCGERGEGDSSDQAMVAHCGLL